MEWIEESPLKTMAGVLASTFQTNYGFFRNKWSVNLNTLLPLRFESELKFV